jgi:hypothetical protein
MKVRASALPWPGGALDEVRGADRKVLPLCPFIKRWIESHREYIDLVYGAPPSNVID